MSGDLEVTGGAGGVFARAEDMLRWADLLDAAGDQLGETARRLGALAADPQLLQAAVLCPGEVAAATGVVLAAGSGPGGALSVSISVELTARVLRTAVETYRRLDEELARLVELHASATGFALGSTAPLLAVGAMSSPLLMALLTARRDDLLAGAEESIYDDPWMAEALTRMAPGMVQGGAFSVAGLLGPGGWALLVSATDGNWPTSDYEGAVLGLIALGRLAGALQDTGRFQVGRVTDAPGREIQLSRTNFLRTLFAEQQELGRATAEVQVIRVDGAGPRPSYVVQIPGTQAWDPVRGDNPVDLTTNLHLEARSATQMQHLVEEAMRRAGIGPDDPVMLAGHSQGGITAASMAADPGFRSRYDVRSVVTGGSPIGRFDLPEEVSVLSLEHEQDIVPMLDGAANPDRPHWVTVRRDLPPGATDEEPVLASHGTDRYLTTAELVDSSTDPSIEAWRQANADFLTGKATPTRYQIEPDR